MIPLLALQEEVKQGLGKDVLKVAQMAQDSVPEQARQGIGGKDLGQLLRSDLAGLDLFCQ